MVQVAFNPIDCGENFQSSSAIINKNVGKIEPCQYVITGINKFSDGIWGLTRYLPAKHL